MSIENGCQEIMLRSFCLRSDVVGHCFFPEMPTVWILPEMERLLPEKSYCVVFA
jgi:hypothetical protein